MTEAQFIAFNGDLRVRQDESRVRLERVEQQVAEQEKRHQQVLEVAEALLHFPSTWKHTNQDERKTILWRIIETLTLQRTPYDLVIRLKLHGCAECIFEVPLQKRQRPKKTARGVAGLTPRHLALLHWLDQGREPAQAAHEMQIQPNTVRTLTMQIRKLMGMHDMQEITRLARGRVHAQLATLPLHGLRGPLVEVRKERPDGVFVSDKLMQVLPLYVAGATTRLIARKLELPMGTVAARRNRILEVFGVKTIYEAGQKAIKLGILPGHSALHLQDLRSNSDSGSHQ